jgi:hypothetical protein
MRFKKLFISSLFSKRNQDHKYFFFRSNTKHICTQCIRNVYAMFTQCIRNVYAMFTQCIRNFYAMYTQSGSQILFLSQQHKPYFSFCFLLLHNFVVKLFLSYHSPIVF